MSMPHQLTQQDLVGLERAMREAGAPVADAFRPGASKEMLDLAAAEFGFALPAELRTWWQWHDGVIDGAEAGVGEPLYPQGPQMLPLDEAVKSYRSWRDRVRRAAKAELPFPFDHPDHLFRPTWVPILSEEHPAILVCDASEQELSPVVTIDAMYEGPEPHTASLGDLITCIRDAYDARVWSKDPSGDWHWHKERLPPAMRAFF
jgi:hypothetical protein